MHVCMDYNFIFPFIFDKSNLSLGWWRVGRCHKLKWGSIHTHKDGQSQSQQITQKKNGFNFHRTWMFKIQFLSNQFQKLPTTVVISENSRSKTNNYGHTKSLKQVVWRQLKHLGRAIANCGRVNFEARSPLPNMAQEMWLHEWGCL